MTADLRLNLWKAIHAVQSEVQYVHKDASNPHYRSKYATLGAVLDVLRPVILKNGLILMQCPGRIEDGCIGIETTLVHVDSGERTGFIMSVPLPKGDPQGAGSAISYGCRYSLMTFCALSALEDDDAEEASKHTRPLNSSPQAAGNGRGSTSSESPPTKLPVSAKLSDTASLAMFEKLKAQMMKFDTRTKLSDWAKGDVNPVITSLRDDDFNTFKDLYSERLKELPA